MRPALLIILPHDSHRAVSGRNCQMATPRDKAPEIFDTVETVGFLAEEDQTDRRMMWRLGTWALCAVGAVTLAVFVGQTSIGQRRTLVADNSDNVRQAQKLQSLIKENQNEANRLALAVETLNNDRDRLYARVSTLEQGLDSVTGTVNRRTAAAITPPPEKPSPAPVPARPETVALAETPSPLMPARSLMSPPDPSASKLSEPAPTPQAQPDPPKAESKPEVVAALPDTPAAEPVPPHHGVDLGAAPTVDGLRLLWRRTAKAHPELAGLQPIIAVRERLGTGGIQLRLVAGPLVEAAATQLCATLGAACAPTGYDGQRLSLAMSTPVTPKQVRRKPVPRPVPAAATETAPLAAR